MATTPTNTCAPVRFGEFELDLRTGELRRNGTPLGLQPQPARILAVLVNRAGEIVSRQELVQEVWGSKTFVDYDQGLNFAIRQIRSALADDAEHPRYLETLPRRGYRFTATVTRGKPVETEGEPAPAPPKPQLRSGRSFRVGILLAALAVLALGLVAARRRLRQVSQPPASTIESVAVLPLHNLSHDPEQEYFSDGMTDELITELAKFGRLKVISHTSVERYKETTRSLPEIARELSVDAVVEGSVTRSGNRVRITAQLIEARTDRHLWAETYDRELQDVLVLQSEVSRDIAAQILNRTAGAGQAAASIRPINPQAHEAYLKGRYFWNKRTEESVKKGIEYFEEATKLDPNYAEPYAGLAASYVVLNGHRYMSPAEAFPKVSAAAIRALELDEKLADAHTSMGSYHWEYEWDKDGGEREFKRAIELNPSDAIAHQWYGEELADIGRGAEAVAEEKRAEELDPLSLAVKVVSGWVRYQGRDYPHAVEEYRRALEMDPNFSVAHLYLGRAYLQHGDAKAGIAELQTACKLAGNHPFFLSWLGYAYAKTGNRSEALRILRQLQSPAQKKYVASHDVAAIYVGLGDQSTAMAWLNRAYDEHSYTVLQLGVEPEFDPLRGDAQFKELLRRVGIS